MAWRVWKISAPPWWLVELEGNAPMVGVLGVAHSHLGQVTGRCRSDGYGRS